jgi:AraC-like DNA-binding protein
MHTHDMEFQMSIIRDIIYGAAARGADFQALCKRINLPPEAMNEADKLIPWETAPYLWDDVIEMTGDELIGLHIGEDARPNFGMLGHLMQTCRTVKEAIESVVSFNSIFSTIFRYSVDYEENKAHFCFEPGPLFRKKYPVSARQSVEMSMSATLRILHTLTGRKIYPVSASLAYPKRQVAEYLRVLRTEVIFNAPQCCLTFSKKDFDTPIISYDQSLYTLFYSLLLKKQKSQTLRKSFAEEVRQVLLVDFKGEIPPIERVAARFCLNIRTFQRRLAAENSSYRIVCQELRKELALAMMESSRTKVCEVAEILGYADPTTFRRAFKNWTHLLPGQIRGNRKVETS